MRRVILICLSLSLNLGLLACASQSNRISPLTLPELRLSPASFGRETSLVQRLTLLRAPQQPATASDSAPQALDVLLEIDTQQLRLAGLAMGQRLLSLQWDGQTLSSERHPWLPKQVQAAQVLRDVQLVYWPATAIRAALPDDWRLEEQAGQRQLFYAGQLQVSIQYQSDSHTQGRAELENHLQHYRLRIESSEISS